MILSRNSKYIQNVKIKFESQEITQADKIQYLGLFMDDKKILS